MRAKLCLVVILSVLGGSCTERRIDTAQDIRCEILLDYAKEWFAGHAPKTRHLNPELPLPMLSQQQLEWLRSRELTHAEERSDLAILEDQVEQAASQTIEVCPQLKALADEQSYQPAQGEVGKTVDEDGLFYGFRTLTLSLPGVDLENGRAGFEAATVCGPLCAGGIYVVYRRRADGSWSKASETPTWVS